MGFDFILRLLFLVQNVVGVLENTIVHAAYALMSYSSQESRLTHLILTNMAIGNLFILPFKEIAHSIYIWGIIHILGSHWIKVAVYMYRVGQGLSLCTTCLLSSFQAMSISQRVGWWMGLKRQAWMISIFCFLCWILSLLINTFGPIHIEYFQHKRNSTKTWEYGFCSSQVSSAFEKIYRVLITLSDSKLIGLMVCTCIYMVLLLYRQQQRVRLFDSFSIFQRLSLEAKTTQSIPLLASIFILFYFTKSILILKNDAIFVSHYWMQYATTFLATYYPTFSP